MNVERIGQAISRLGESLTALAVGQVVLWLAIAVAVFFAVRLARRLVDRHVTEVNRRHQLRKLVGYLGVFLVLVVAVALFIGKFGHLATILGLVGAGLAIALQDIGKSAAGWLYLTSRSGFGPGARVEVEGLVGEVIDVGILKTTVLEVGNLVRARQSSGRLATIPNSKFLSQNVYLSPSFSPYAWQEIPFLLTYESDWRRAVGVLEELGEREFEELEAETEHAFHQLERRYAFKYGARTPIVYLRAVDSGVELTLRILTHIRQRRGIGDRITRAFLEAVAGDPDLDFAYPTTRVYQRGEEEGWGLRLSGPLEEAVPSAAGGGERGEDSGAGEGRPKD